MERDQNADEDDSHSQRTGEGVGAIRLVPLAMSDVQLSLAVHVTLVLRHSMVIHEAHDWAVGDQWNDTVGLIRNEFQCSDPQEDDHQSQSKKAHSNAVQPCCLAIQGG